VSVLDVVAVPVDVTEMERVKDKVTELVAADDELTVDV
jgi:hypothetical protein